jgi:site-specific recombinase XerD
VRGDGYVYKRGPRWWVGYYRDGKLYREPARIPDAAGAPRPAKDEAEARRFLKARLRDILSGRSLGPQEERLTVADLLDGVKARAQTKGLRSLSKITSHLRAVREVFALRRAVDVTPLDVERYVQDRRAAGKADATINRELELLRRGYRLGIQGKLISASRAPEIELLRVDNVRSGFFTVAEVETLLQAIPDTDVRDFVEWGFLTGQRKGSIARLTWDMLDRSGPVWVLQLPASIEKNKSGRALGLSGRARSVIERRLKARRLDCPLIFHRTSKGKAAQPVKEIAKLWRNALEAAELPAGRLFHDLRRSAVRNLIRAGVDPSVAMRVSGHKTRSMLDRYNIIGADETAAALSQTDAYLSTQPRDRNLPSLGEHAQNAHNRAPRRKA